MAVVEGAGHIVRCVNPAFCRLMGKPSERLIGMPFAETMPAKDECLPLLDRVYRTGKPESYTEQHPEPHSVFWSFTMWPVLAEERPVGMMIQVTETAQLHEKTVAMNEALVLGSLRQHELTEAGRKKKNKTPKTKKPKPLKKKKKKGSLGPGTLTGITNHERRAVLKLLKEAIRNQPEFQSPHAEIEIQSPMSRVIAHEPSLMQCANNLLSNAVKFVLPGVVSRVTVRSESWSARTCGCGSKITGSESPPPIRKEFFLSLGG